MASQSVQAERAVGRCYGALFLSCFGGAWLLLAAYAVGGLSPLRVCLIAASTMVFVTLAIRFRTRAKEAGAETPDPLREERRDNRTFGIVKRGDLDCGFSGVPDPTSTGPRGLGDSCRGVDSGIALLSDAASLSARRESANRRLHGGLGHPMHMVIRWRSQNRVCRPGRGSSAVGRRRVGA